MAQLGALCISNLCATKPVQYINSKFYCMYAGTLTSSTDGVAFNDPPVPFFHMGMQAEVYKPCFLVGHDTKIKCVFSVGARTSVPEPFINDLINSQNLYSRTRYVPLTVCFEHASITEIETMQQTIRKDAFVDVVVIISRERTNEFLY